MHILAALTGLSGLKKQTHTIGRAQWLVIWEELEWSKWALSWLKIYYIRISNSQIVKHNTNIGALTKTKNKKTPQTASLICQQQLRTATFCGAEMFKLP